MELSRRSFVRAVGAGAAGVLATGLIAARGHEALLAQENPPKVVPPLVSPGTGSAPLVRLDSNENPNGPHPAALEAIRGAFNEAGRYPDRPADDLQENIARFLGVPLESVLLGCGSTEILRTAVHAFTSPERGLVTAAPSFEHPIRYAEIIGSPFTTVRVNDALEIDLAGMAANAPGAGLIFLCNPNNPTGSVRPAAAVKEFVARVLKDSPGTTILVDEAYHDYVEDPAYATAIPMAMENPRVIVSRTFSKVHGMAGLRVGYAVGQTETLKALRRHRIMESVNVLGAVAALASLGRRDHVEGQRRLNHEAREFTRRFFETAGYRVFPSEANFLMIDVRRDVRAFRDECRERGVLVGRPFPPLDTFARITIGTMEEMRRAAERFKEALAAA